MEEPMVCKNFTCKDIEEIIKDNIRVVDEKFAQIAPLFVRTGYYLRRQYDKKMYEDAGFDKFEDYVKETYGKSRSWAKRMMQINEKFSIDGNNPLMNEQFVGYSVSHLQEMLYLTDEQLEEVTPEMTVKEIREIRKPAVEEEVQEEPVSILGYPVRVYTEGSLLTTKGCGKQSCFSCHRDGCELRQEDCYCVEAPMGNPFPCTTLNVVDMLREEIGSCCQFVNEDLAYHRAGDGQPVPCCKECNNKCGYACGRGRSSEKESEKILTEEENINDAVLCDVAQESTDQQEAEVRHFTSDTTVDNAYGWTWDKVIKEYLKNGYANSEKESTVVFLGKTYKVLKRAEVTVFYDENGNTLFDVTNDRLQEEYEWSHRNTEQEVSEEQGEIVFRQIGKTSIDELNLSVRTYNCLKRAGVDTIEQLRNMSDEDLAKVRNFGKYNLDEIHKKLTEYDEQFDEVAAVEDCATSHTEEIADEERVEELTEDSDIEIVKKTLERENRMLCDMQKCYTENDWRVRRQKLLVGALANFVIEIEDIIDSEPEPAQPELSMLKNNDQRKAFIDNYMDWPIWLETKETGERYYRYNFENGTAFVVKVYYHRCFDQVAATTKRFEECYSNKYGSEEYYLILDNKFLKDCLTNRSALVEHLKNIQKVN